MKVLWLCNMMLPMIAEQFGMEASNKEGWLSGLAEVMLERQEENDVELSVAFPASRELLVDGKDVIHRDLEVGGARLSCYGFYEDIVNPHLYDDKLEKLMAQILEMAKPDVVHCFGTEYPHTLAMCRVFQNPQRLLVTIQGVCSAIAEAYEADLPKSVVQGMTFRDRLRKDGILQQKEKFVLRGEREREILRLAGNVGGRTPFDHRFALEQNPNVRYFTLRETLRGNFYEGLWEEEKCERHSILISQGDYPIKGLHYALLALPQIIKEVPDVKVYVAGNSIVSHKTIKDRIKISNYGKYLLSLIRKNSLEERVIFLGRLNAGEMRECFLKSSLFVCCSAMENSPNSLGEAMLLGMPCVAADVGGVNGIFTPGEDGVGYEGTRIPIRRDGEGELLRVAENLARAVLEIWSDDAKRARYCENARRHALLNHDRKANYDKTMETYAEVAKVESME